jgi:pilus assembly protein Flp/PilA
MKDLKKTILRFLREEEGLTTVEYAVAGALVAAAVIVAFENLGTEVGETVDGLATTLDNAQPAAATP